MTKEEISPKEENEKAPEGFKISDIAKIRHFGQDEITIEEKSNDQDEEDDQEDDQDSEGEYQDDDENSSGEDLDDDSEEGSEEDEGSEGEGEDQEEGSEEEEDDDSEEEESEGEDQDSEEGSEEDGEDEEDELKTPEFNVFEETDGVFETIEELKETASLLKENPELKGMLDYYKENGTLLPYLEATQINPDDIGDIDILFENFKSEYGDVVKGLSSSELNQIFKEDILSNFDLDSEDPVRVKLAEGKLAQKAKKIREGIKEELALKRLPINRDGKEAADKVAKEAKEKLESSKNKLAFQLRKEVKDGKMTIKVSEDVSVTQKVSPKKISELLDKTKDFSLFTNEKGDFDLVKMAILTDKDAFIESVIQDSAVSANKDFVRKELKKRKPKAKGPEGDSKPKKIEGFLDPTDIKSFKGAKIKRV